MTVNRIRVKVGEQEFEIEGAAGVYRVIPVALTEIVTVQGVE